MPLWHETTVTMVGTGGWAAKQDFSDARVLTPTRRIVIRDVADGAGPSHLIAVAGYLLVVDPWAATILRYATSDLAAPPHACALPRGFAPWRTVRTVTGLRLVAEPFGPEEAGEDYDLRPRATMIMDADVVAAMPVEGVCPFPVVSFDPVRDAPSSGTREVGALANGRRMVWWSAVAARPGGDGRVSTPQFVGIVDPDGETPGAILCIRSAAYPPLVADTDIAVPSLLVKPGFEYAVGATGADGDMLWVMAADMRAAGQRSFVLNGYSLADLREDDRAVVALVAPGGIAVDRNDQHSPDDPRGPWVAPERPRFGSRTAWFADAQARLRAQIGHRWRYPDTAIDRPCGGADICAVGASDAGALGAGFAYPVRDKHSPDGGALWMRPRPLIGLTAGEEVRGIPYAIGGFDLADGFDRRLATTYGAGVVDPPPIGHIREGLEWPQQVAHYPLGIDCSALVAEIFGIAVRSTATMVAPQSVTTVASAAFRLPCGPSGAYPEPVRHLDDLLPGDVLLRDGHIVIFAGVEPTTSGLRVIEASARCGGVAESVYDPSFFDGWWMLRLAIDGIDDGPCWLGEVNPRP